MEKNKNGSSLLIIILLIALFASLGYIAYDKILLKEEPKEKNEQTEEKTSQISYNKDGLFIKNLMKKILYLTGYSHSEFQLYAKDKVTVDDLDDNYKNTLIMKELRWYSKETLKEKSQELFGKNIYTIYPETISFACSKYKLNDNGEYTLQPQECGIGGTGYRYEYSKITKVESDANHIYVYQKAGFQCELGMGICKNMTLNENGTYDNERYIPKDNIKTLQQISEEVNMDEILEQLNEYKFTFTYDTTNNIYYFESVEKI